VVAVIVVLAVVAPFVSQLERFFHSGTASDPGPSVEQRFLARVSRTFGGCRVANRVPYTDLVEFRVFCTSVRGERGRVGVHYLAYVPGWTHAAMQRGFARWERGAGVPHGCAAFGGDVWGVGGTGARGRVSCSTTTLLWCDTLRHRYGRVETYGGWTAVRALWRRALGAADGTHAIRPLPLPASGHC
jgi:hypothetical protein